MRRWRRSEREALCNFFSARKKVLHEIRIDQQRDTFRLARSRNVHVDLDLPCEHRTSHVDLARSIDLPG